MIKALDKPLQKYALGINYSNLIGLNLMPKIAVDAESFILPKWNSNSYVIPDSTIRAMRGLRAELEMGDFESIEVQLDEHTFKYRLDVRERVNIGRNLLGYNPDKIAINDSMLRLNIEREKAIADILTSTASFASGNSETISTSTAKWDTSTGDPIKDITDGMDVVLSKVGQYPTDIYMGYAVFNALRMNEKILAIMKTTADKILTPSVLATILGVNNVWVGTQTYKTSVSATPTDIWGNNFGMVVVNPSANNTPTPAFGITPEFANLSDMIKVEEIEAGKIFEYTPTLFYKPIVTMDNAGFLYKTPLT
jgi:hypothetical protein